LDEKRKSLACDKVEMLVFVKKKNKKKRIILHTERKAMNKGNIGYSV